MRFVKVNYYKVLVINVNIMFYMIIVLIPSLHIAVRASQPKISRFRFCAPVTYIQRHDQLEVKGHLIFN